MPHRMQRGMPTRHREPPFLALSWDGLVPCSGDETSPSQCYVGLVGRCLSRDLSVVQSFARGLAENDVSSARHWRVWGRNRSPDR